MKLVHSDYAFQIEFQEGIVQKLILEAPALMSEFIIDLKKQMNDEEGKWVLSHNGEILEISDNCELITSIFDLEINQRKMLNALYDELADEINDTELLIEWKAVNSNLEGILNQAIEGTGYAISYGELTLKDLFKAIDLKFQEVEEGYVDYLLEYLQMMSEVRKIHVFIIVNLTSFLTETEMEYLYEQVSYKKYMLLLVDTQNVRVNERMERTIVVDKDYCVIDASMS